MRSLQTARGDGAAAHEAAAAHGGDEYLERRRVGQQLQRRRALAGDDGVVVVGVDEARAGLGRKPRGRLLARGEGGGAGGDLAAVGAYGGLLHGRRVLGHDDVGRHAPLPRGEGQRRGEVARGVGEHAGGGLVVRKQEHRVHRSADLEGARALEALALEDQRGAGQRVQARAAHDNRAVDVAGQARRRGFDGAERGFGRHGSPLAGACWRQSSPGRRLVT